MKKVNLGIIGCGNMALAIIMGIAAGGMDEYLKKEKAELFITVSDPDPAQLEKAAATGYERLTLTQMNDVLCESSDYVLLAVKPQSAAQALENAALKDKVVISIMAGVTAAKIRALSGSDKVVRVMPNLNAQIGKSLNSYASLNLSAPEEAFTGALLASFGENVKIPEERINAATGIAGSGPAFVFMFVKAFKDVAVKYGFSEADAITLAAKTVMGSAEHIYKAGAGLDIDKLVGSVCSKGGTTIEGVNFLREKEFESVVCEAIERAVKRAEELGR